MLASPSAHGEVTAEEALDAFATVQGWVREADADTPLEHTDAGLLGACVLLRLDGQLLGRGTSMRFGPDDTNVLGRAASRAIREAFSRVELPSGVLRDAALRDAGARMTLSLELAHELTPAPGHSLAEMGLGTSWGREGVAARLGPDGVTNAFFPSLMLTTGVTPVSALRSVISQRLEERGVAGFAIAERLREMRQEHDLRVFRFQTTHIAQPAPGSGPVFLHRGTTPRSPRDVFMSEQDLRTMAHWLATNLAQRITRAPGDAIMAGTLTPLTEPADAPRASDAEFALAAFAIREYVGVLNGDNADRWRGVLDLVRQRLDAVEPAADDAVLCALIALASDDTDEQHESCLSALLAGDENTPMPGFASSVVSAASAQRGTEQTIDRARALVRARFAEVAPERLAGEMPWLCWAELELAEEDGPVPAGTVLRRMRALVWEHQLTLADTRGEDVDLLGGIVFTRGGGVLPSWHSARVLAAVGTMLGDDRLTDPEERDSEIVRLLTGLGFLRQLQVRKDTLWMYPSEELCLGAVRSGPGDASLPVDATSMTLLAVVETMRSLDRLSEAQE